MTYSLNRSARVIWELCDGTFSVDDIGREIGQAVGVSPEAVLPDILEAIEKLCELDLVELSAVPSKGASEDDDSTDGQS